MNKQTVIDAITSAKHDIPEQGTLDYFVHHNTIHHYEHMDFFDAVKKAANEYNCNAFMPEEFYRHQYTIRKIDRYNLEHAIHNFKDSYNVELHDDIIFRLLMDESEPEAKFDKEIQEINKKYYTLKREFFSGRLKGELGVNMSYYVQPVIYKFFSVYFDYGNAYWPLEDRAEGMWSCFKRLHRKASLFDSKYKRKLAKWIRHFNDKPAAEVISHIAIEFEIKDEFLFEFFFEMSLRHKGWAGYTKALESRPEWIKLPEIKPDFIEFIAIVLICEYAVIKLFYKEPKLIDRTYKIPKHSEKFLNIFLTEKEKHKLHGRKFMDALPFLSDFNRQEIFHQAYENSFDDQFLNAYANACYKRKQEPHQIDYQVITCIDDREESFRRYLEVDPNCETFSCAGHFGLNILYKSYFDKHYRALCPQVVTPEYKVTETVKITKKAVHKGLHIWSEIHWLSEMASKTIIYGTLQTFVSAISRVIPFSLDMIDPKITYKYKKWRASHRANSIHTRLNYKKEKADDIGIPFEDRVKIARDFFVTLGLVKNFAPYIIVTGHGSSSLNNPHLASYNCGACCGGHGSPNARLMSKILSETAVRKALAEQYDLHIPEETKFVAAYHNTTNDDVIFFDKFKEPFFEEIKAKILKAGAFDAKERCRRFAMLPVGKDEDYYLKHVQARSMDIRQTRPEYGHATNAICILGNRSNTRHLFLDRRAFLVSYDSEQDNDSELLNKLVNTAVPVCAGINLEYYFSFIDNEFYGCGTKLPHNVSSLVGVMNGFLSDLQLGLPWQTVEIHQPVRLYIVIECTVESVEKLLKLESIFSTLVKNSWVKLAIYDNEVIWVYDKGEFKKFMVAHSTPKYFSVDNKIMNSHDHLDFGEII